MVGWSECLENNTYLQGLYINDPSDTGTAGYYRLEGGKCSAGGVGFVNQPSTCTKGNWGSVLDR